MKGRTSVVIAHQLGTIRHADVIFVIKDCALAEQGTHETLMALNGVYAELLNIQTPEEEREPRSQSRETDHRTDRRRGADPRPPSRARRRASTSRSSASTARISNRRSIAAVAKGVRVTALIAFTNRGGEPSLRKLELRFLAAGIIVARTSGDLSRYHDKFIVDRSPHPVRSRRPTSRIWTSITAAASAS